MPIMFVYITNPTKQEARKIAKHLINKKLIACANIYSGINSIYLWKGKMADETEHILIAKTDAKNYNKIAKEVEKIHSYTIPCIIRIPFKANKKYEKWLNDCLK